MYLIYHQFDRNKDYNDVNVFDLKAGTITNLTEKDISNNVNKDIDEIYYYTKYDLCHKDFTTNRIENNVYKYEEYYNNRFYINENKTLIREDISTNEKENIIENINDFLVGENKIYYLNRFNIFHTYDIKNNIDKIIENNLNVSKNLIVEYSADVFAYALNKKIIKCDSAGNKEEIFTINDDGAFYDISLISDTIMQISVLHLGVEGPFWSVDKYYRYNFETGELTECSEGYSILVPLTEYLSRPKYSF